MKSNKLFPEISKDLYNSRSNLNNHFFEFAVSSDTTLKASQLSKGWKLKRIEKVLRVFHLHKKAFNAEMEMKAIEADFFWDECYREFRKLLADELIWKELADKFQVNESVREAVLKELFISTHIAFCNGYLANPENATFHKRALRHLVFIDKITSDVLIEQKDSKQELYFKQLAWFKINAYGKLNEKEKVIPVCESVVAKTPQDRFFLKQLISSVYENAVLKLKSGKNEPNLLVLEQSINKLESFHLDAERIDTYYYRLGNLYQYYSIALANTSKLSKALLAIRKAYTYNPYIENIHETWLSLVREMEELQKQMEILMTDIRSSPNKHLTSDGYKLKTESDVGFTLVNDFINNEEENIIAKRRTAYLEGLLYDIGVADLDDENRMEFAEAVNTAINELLEVETTDIESVRNILANLSDEDPSMPPLPKEKIIKYVIDYKSGKSPNPDEEILKALNNEEINAINIAPAFEVINKKEPPFVYWLYSRQDLFTKICSVAAVIIILVTSGLTLQKFYKDYKRNVSYDALTVLLNKKADHQMVLDRAGIFLDNLPLLGTDLRTAEVTSTYQKELAKWFMEGESIDKDAFLSHLKRFKKLSSLTHEQPISL